MLYWAAIFFIVAIVAAALGFSGVAVETAVRAKLLFFVFVALFAIALTVGLVREQQ